LGCGGRELPAVGFFNGNSRFRFSLAQAFLYIILGGVGRPRERKNIHVCPLHMEPRQLGCALATQCLDYFVRAVSKGFEPSGEGRTVTYHGHWKGCGGISDEEVCFLAVLRRCGSGSVHKTGKTKLKKGRGDISRTYLRTIWWDSVKKTSRHLISRRTSLDRTLCSIRLRYIC
jgi:hypothetical protein